jgi:hypothetical protein
MDKDAGKLVSVADVPYTLKSGDPEFVRMKLPSYDNLMIAGLLVEVITPPIRIALSDGSKVIAGINVNCPNIPHTLDHTSLPSSSMATTF